MRRLVVDVKRDELVLWAKPPIEDPNHGWYVTLEPGEAALIESEMKRFREWAALKVRACIRAQNSWHHPQKCDLVVFERKYWAVPSAHRNTLEHGARVVYSPEEGA